MLATDFLDAVKVDKMMALEGNFAELSKAYLPEWLATEDQRDLESAATRADIVHRILKTLEKPLGAL